MGQKLVRGSGGGESQHQRGERQHDEDRRDAAGRRMARVAARAAHERDEEREQLETDADALLDEIDEVLEDEEGSEGETDAKARTVQRLRLRRSDAERVEDMITHALRHVLGDVALQEAPDEQQVA